MLKKSNKMEASPFQRRGGGAVAWWLTPRTPDPGLLCCVLEQDIFTPKSTGNSQEAVALSQHD